VLIILILLLFLIYGLLHLPRVQTYLVKQATQALEKKLGTPVRIESVDLRFFYFLELNKLYVEDKKGDTLIYAGTAMVKVNDWFFFKDHVELKYLGLEDGLVRMTRKTKAWNYEYILDALSDPDTTQKKSNLQLDIHRLTLKNIRFDLIDQWKGQNMITSIDQLDARFDSVDLKKSIFRLSKVSIKRPYFSMVDYKGTRSLEEEIAAHADTSSASNPMDISIQTISITNGRFSSDDPDEPSSLPGLFDEWHMRFDDIQAELKKTTFKNDELKTAIQLSSNERSGFKIRALQADMTFNQSMMEFKNLLIRTDKSKIGDYYAMHYCRFNDDMKEFITKVGLTGKLKNSTVHTDDIAYFAPELKNWHRSFLMNGAATGTIDDFKIRKMQALSGSTKITGNLDMKHMDDLDSLLIDFNTAGTETNYEELAWLILELKNTKGINLNKLGNIKYAGNFKGSISKFISKGEFQTSSGRLKIDLSMHLPENNQATYALAAEATQLDLGRILGYNQIGRPSFTTTISGTGLHWKEMNTKFQISIPSLPWGGYNYQNIESNGSLQQGKLLVKTSISDKYLNIPELIAAFDFNKKNAGLNITGNLEHADFRELKWLDRDLILSTKFNLDFKGDHIENANGFAQFNQLSITHAGKKIPFTQVLFKAKQDEHGKDLRLIADQLEAGISGSYKIKDLSDAFLAFLNNYYPSYIPKPNRRIEQQQFEFDLKTKNIEELIKIIDPKMKGGNNATVLGSLNLEANRFLLNAKVPYFAYDEKSIRDLDLKSYGNRDTLQANLQVSSFQINDDVQFPSTSLSFSSNNDLTDIQLKSAEGNLANQIDLNVKLKTYQDGALIHFNPSSFYLRDKKWEITPEGEISVHKNQIHVDRFALFHDQERISLSTALNEETNQTSLRAEIDQVNIEDFLPLIFSGPEIRGKLTGTATLQDPFKENKLNFLGKLDSLSIEQQYVGGLVLNGKFEPSSGVVDYHAKSTDTSNIFEINGQYQTKDSGLKQMMTTLTGEKIRLNILYPFLSDVFSELDGIAKTNLTWWGNDKHPYLTGTAFIETGHFKIDYTQVRYFLNNQTILFEQDAIRMDMLQLKDSLNNTGTCSGVLYHQFFDDFEFKNLRLESPKLSLLNTTKVNNSQFYGQAIGKANLSLNGPLNNLKLILNAEPLTLDSSQLYLNTSDQKESKSTDYIEFLKTGEVEVQTKKNDDLNILVTVNVKANPACKIFVILDEETGDIIKGQGNGNISVSVGNIEPLKIRGNYELTKGEYTFNFQTYFKKPFILNRGTINWNGDPYQAIINIDAEYVAKNVDISPLSSTGGFVQKEDVTIIAHLSGVLQNPTVKFDITLEDRSESKRNDVIVKRMADFKNDDNEMNKQVASLLLFNTFLIGNQNFLSQGNASTLFTNTIGGVVSNLLTSFFNRELEKATKGVLSTYIDINPTLNLEQNASQLQANIRAGLKILLDKRLQVLVGGNLDYNNPIYTQQLERRGLLTPDITIEWLINKDGTLRIVGFNRSSIDFSLSQRNRSGLRLSYRKDFNRLVDLFSGKKQ
jgi:hypothetical protein